MASLDRPKLRPMSVKQLAHEGETYAALLDPLGIVAEPLLVPIDAYYRVVRCFDGTTTLSEIQARVMRQTGQLVPLADLEGLVEQLDRALALDGPAFAAYRDAYRRELVRPAALAGRSYAGTERALRAQLAQFFAHANGAGAPRQRDRAPSGRLRGILSPHIDFYRGGPVYTWSYRELVERSDADTFVILGVAHQYCRRRFALTRKDFETPLGLALTDRTYVDRIAALAGQDLFEGGLVSGERFSPARAARRTRAAAGGRALGGESLMVRIVPVIGAGRPGRVPGAAGARSPAGTAGWRCQAAARSPR